MDGGHNPGHGSERELVSPRGDALRGEAAGIVDRWIRSLPEGNPPRTPELERAYRALGVELIDRIAHGIGEPGPPPSEPLTRDQIRSLAWLAAESRRSSRAIWQTLDDVQRLLPEILSSLRSVPRIRGGLDQGSVACALVSDAAAATARVLEATALRFEREQSDSRASMADMMIHELRNRLSAAETASRMLMAAEAPVEPTWLARVADLIRSSVEAGLRTVEDVRSLAASRTQAGVIQPRPVPLALLLQDVVRELEPQAAEKGVRLAVEDEWPEVLVDASRFRLILVNLMGNAIKYHDPLKEDPRVEVGIGEPDGEDAFATDAEAGGDGEMADGALALFVRDNGMGIDPSEVQDVFLHRFRGDDARRLDGSGLGLAIAREAAEQLGARLTVSSRFGESTTFQVIFHPLADPAEDLLPTSSPPPGRAPA